MPKLREKRPCCLRYGQQLWTDNFNFPVRSSIDNVHCIKLPLLPRRVNGFNQIATVKNDSFSGHPAKPELLLCRRR